MHKGLRYYMGQRPYMIELITKKLKINCSKCHGVGHDVFQQLCFKCNGDGHISVPVSLFEMIGMVQVAGTRAVSGEEAVSYSVNYYQLYHVREDERAELSKRAWKSYDDGPDVMAGRRHCNIKVEQSALFVMSHVARDEAHDLNVALLGDIAHNTKIDLINQFNETTITPDNTPLVDAIISAHGVVHDHDAAPPMGEYPALTCVSSGVTDVEFERVLGPVDIEPALK